MTFDDGYPDWPTVIAPALKARGLPATFFVTTSQLRGQPMWSERIATLLRKGRPAALQSLHPAIPHVDWSNSQTREAAVEPVTACLKYLRLPFRDALIDRMEHACQTRLEEVPIFRPEHLRTLHDLGFDIGAHTVDHPILTYCTESEARLEISRARDDLSELVGADVRHFAYPNGKPMADYSARDIALIKQCGYAGAVTTAQGSLRLGCSPYQIPRFAPWGQAAWQPVRQLLSNLRRDGEQLAEV
jgi:peptidoglycan/xylan/chitin deacetylase (PgdA/CDA1 family)